MRPEPFEPGTVLEQRYRIDDEVGRGGMGVVYRGTDLILKRPVAIKALWGHAASEDTVDRFLTEARALAQVEHSRVVPVYAVGRQGSAYFMVMKFVEGTSLSELLKETPALPPERVRSILLQSLDALGALHSRGLVHRDVKPGNLMIQPDGQVTLMDLGIARDLNDASSTTQALGTPRYMAPETLRNQPEDARTDLYSLALIGWHTLAGRPPFDGPTPMAILYKQAHAQAQSLREVAPHAPKDLIAVIERAMAKDPDERFEDAQAMSLALRGATRAGGRTSSKGPLLGLVAGLILALLGGYLGWQSRPSAPEVHKPAVATITPPSAALPPLPPPRIIDLGVPPSPPDAQPPDAMPLPATPKAPVVKAGPSGQKPARRAPPVAAPVKIELTSRPSGATVYAEGKRIGRTPYTWQPPKAGRSVDLTFERHGHRKASARANLGANGKIHVQLEPLFDLVP